MITKLITGLLLLWPVLHVSAQEDDHVYVTDQINFGDYIEGNKYTFYKTFTKNATTYYSIFSKHTESTAIFPEEGRHGIITKASNNTDAYLRQISLTWGYSYSKDRHINIFGKDEPYSNISELYDGQNSGQLIGVLDYDTDKKPDTQTITFEPQYRFWGMYQNIDIIVSSLTITWQLIHKRHDVTPGNLATLCLPYNVKSEDMDGVTAYTLIGKTVGDDNLATSLIFEPVENLIAGQPYLIIYNKDEVALPYSGSQAMAPISKNGMIGVYDRHPFSEDSNYNSSYYVIANNRIQAASRNSGVNANCAFINMDDVPTLTGSSSSNRALVLTADGFSSSDTATSFQHTSEEPNSEVYTDLLGRNVVRNASPYLLIVNGKKQFIR